MYFTGIKRCMSLGIALVIVFTFSYLPVQACIIFTAGNGDSVLVGNHEDWMYAYTTHMTVTAPGESGYGRVCFYISSYVQGGMNEFGLCYDSASCPSSETPYFEGAPQLGMDFGEQVLAKCKTVEEAVKMLKQNNIPKNFSEHMLFTDSTGASCVIEWVEGELRIIEKEKDYQLVTNFWLSNPELGWYPCSRFDTATEKLSTLGPSIKNFASILEATSQDWGEGGTLYSTIYDLKKKEVYIFSMGNMTDLCKISLTDRLISMQKDEKLTIPTKDLHFDMQLKNLTEEGLRAAPSSALFLSAETSSTSDAALLSTETQEPSVSNAVIAKPKQTLFSSPWLLIADGMIVITVCSLLVILKKYKR